MTEYRNPKPTVDIVVFLKDDNGELTNNIVLVTRRNPPYGLAIPGGFVNEGESYEDAARREAKEEISLDVKLIHQFHTYSRPDRDPRQHTASTVYLAEAQGEPTAADDAAAVTVVNLYEAQDSHEQIAFDHRQILSDVCDYLVGGDRPLLD